MTRRDYVKRDPDGSGVVVHWDSEACIHSGVCLGSLPTVFDRGGRPWIDVEGDASGPIARTVALCPSKALRLSRFTAGEQPPLSDESADDAATVRIKVLRSGPYLVKGTVEVVDSAGNVSRTTSKVALCRCGNSANKPFCDGTHHRVKFADPGDVPPQS